MHSKEMPERLTRLNVRTLEGSLLDIAAFLRCRNVIDAHAWDRIRSLAGPVTPIDLQVPGLFGSERFQARCTWDPDCQPQLGEGFWYGRPLDSFAPWVPFDWNPEATQIALVSTYMTELGRYW